MSKENNPNQLLKVEIGPGVNLYYIENKESNMFTHSLVLPAGSSYENDQEHGIAHFIEHLLWKLLKVQLNEEEIEFKEEDISAINQFFGGYKNMHTNMRNVWPWIRTFSGKDSKKVEQIIAFSALSLKYVYFDDQVAKAELSPIISELQGNNASLDRSVLDLFFEKNYPQWGHRIIGKVEDLLSGKPEDLLIEKVGDRLENVNLRYKWENFLSYKNLNFHKELNIYAYGSVPVQELARLYEKYFSDWVNQSSINTPKKTPNFKPIFYTEHREEKILKVIIGFSLDALLKKNKENILFVNILKKLLSEKLTIITEYLQLGNQAAAMNYEHNTLGIKMSLSNDNDSEVKDSEVKGKHNTAIKLALLIFQSLKIQLQKREDNVEKYFEELKEYLIGRLFFQGDINSYELLMSLQSDIEYFGEELTLEDWKKKYQELKFDDFIEFLNEFKTEKISFTALGNTKNLIQEQAFNAYWNQVQSNDLSEIQSQINNLIPTEEGKQEQVLKKLYYKEEYKDYIVPYFEANQIQLAPLNLAVEEKLQHIHLEMHPDSRSNLVYIQIFIPIDFKSQTPDQAVLFDLLVSSLLRGSKNERHKQYDENLKKIFFNFGNIYDIEIVKDGLEIVMGVVPEKLKEVIAFLFHLLHNPVFDEEILKELKEQLWNSVQNMQVPSSAVQKAFAYAFKGSFIGKRRVDFNKEEIDSVTIQDIKAYYQKYLKKTPLVVIYGAISDPEAIKKELIYATRGIYSEPYQPQDPKNHTKFHTPIPQYQHWDLPNSNSNSFQGCALFDLHFVKGNPRKVLLLKYLHAIFSDADKIFFRELRIKTSLCYGAAGFIDSHLYYYALRFLTTSEKANDVIDFLLVNIYRLKYILTQKDLDIAKEDFINEAYLREDKSTGTVSDLILKQIQHFGKYISLEEEIKEYNQTNIGLDELQSFIDDMIGSINLTTVGKPDSTKPMRQEIFQARIHQLKAMSAEEIQVEYFNCLAQILIKHGMESVLPDETKEQAIQRIIEKQQQTISNPDRIDINIEKLSKIMENWEQLMPAQYPKKVDNLPLIPGKDSSQKPNTIHQLENLNYNNNKESKKIINNSI